ncbi:hypothetical protein BC833DRAFT_642335 [Globomyces pollinis-pini]|nr:hypothetical protein BC833DRAFT_642335 [Globomyces pollinis-pini]
MKLHCLKRGATCRYRFPKELVSDTHYNPRQKRIFHKRANPYINANAPVISAVLRCNNDIQFLPGNGKPQICRYIAYYISNYTSKTSTQTTELLSFMVKKLSSIEKYSPEIITNEKRLFDSLLMKTLNMFVGGNEIGGPEIASTLIGMPDHYTGESFCPLDWKAWDRWVCFGLKNVYDHHYYTKLQSTSSDQLNEILRIQQSSELGGAIPLQQTHTFRDQKWDYLYRHNSLEDVCLYAFIKKYQFTSSSDHENVLLFWESHPLYMNDLETGLKSGVFEKRKEDTITLPWFNSTSAIHGLGTENFARIMTFLFKPFRTPRDLLEHRATFKEALKDFKFGKDFRLPPIKYLYNMEYSATASKEAQLEKNKANAQLPPDYFDEQLLDLHDDKWIVVASHLPDSSVGEHNPSILSRGSTANIKEILKNQNAFSMQITEEDREERIMNSNFDQPNVSHISILLDNPLEVMFIEFVKAQKSKTCEVQWGCIKLVAKYFLDLIRDQNPSPITAVLHGEGGTGKSYIIDVITAMVQLLKRPEWLIKCAFTGKASINIEGDTIDGVFGFSRTGITVFANVRQTKHKHSFSKNFRGLKAKVWLDAQRSCLPHHQIGSHLRGTIVSFSWGFSSGILFDTDYSSHPLVTVLL